MRLRLIDRVRYLKDYWVIKRQSKNSDVVFKNWKFYPCLKDWHMCNGFAEGHYFHQDLLVAHQIYLQNPERHIDIGSRVDGFVAHVASFREIEVFDVRPLESPHPNIVTKQLDFMQNYSGMNQICDSLSCLHALEHFGLGRYGDSVDYEGHLKGLKSMANMLREGGKFYFSVPIGPQRIEFNAHRVFDVKYIADLLQNQFKIDSFHYVDDDGDLHRDVPWERDMIANNYMCFYGCGIFFLTKKLDVEEPGITT